MPTVPRTTWQGMDQRGASSALASGDSLDAFSFHSRCGLRPTLPFSPSLLFFFCNGRAVPQVMGALLTSGKCQESKVCQLQRRQASSFEASGRKAVLSDSSQLQMEK